MDLERQSALEADCHIAQKNMETLHTISLFMVLTGGIMFVGSCWNPALFHHAELNGYYQGLYIFLMLFGVLFFVLSHPYCTKKDSSTTPQKKFLPAQLRRISLYLNLFFSGLLLWGVSVSLLDQSYYSQVVVFLLCQAICVSLLLFPLRKLLQLEAVPMLLLVVLLPVFQSDRLALFDCYATLIVLLLYSMVSGGRAYKSTHHEVYMACCMRRLSELDELTGLPNRRRMKSFFSTYADAGSAADCCVFMLDVDHFKAYNDTYGHLAGDELLELLGKRLAEFSAQHNLFCARYGGEEFILVAEGLSQASARQLVKILQEQLQSVADSHVDTHPIPTVSIGACWRASIADLVQLIPLADRALYLAKWAGRNQVHFLTQKEEDEVAQAEPAPKS